MSTWNFIIITGASRGLGRAIAVSFCKLLNGPTHFVLTGRSLVDLNETKTLIESALTRRTSTEETCVSVFPADLSKKESVGISNDLFGFAIKSYPERTYSNAIFINNAGSLGQLQVIQVLFYSVTLYFLVIIFVMANYT